MSPAEYGAPRRRGGVKWLPILLFGGYLVYYYFSNQQVVPFTGRKQLVDMSREQESQLGLMSYRQALSEAEVVRGDHPLANQVKTIGKKLVAVSEDQHYQWEFNLINSAEINAFAVPGGKVAVYAGILKIANNENALAAVMGHEVGHVIARHGAERMAQQKLVQIGSLAAGVAISDMDPAQQRTILGALGLGAQYGVLLPFSRDHENEADRIGLILASRACYDPREAPALWERMSQLQGAGGRRPEFMSTHPSDDTRIRRLRALLPEALAEREKHCAAR